MPVTVGFAIFGVTVSLFSDTQYSYCVSPKSPVSVMVLPETLYLSFVVGLIDSTPSPPVWLTLAEQSQPPPATDLQVSSAYPRGLVRRLATPSQLTGVEEMTRHEGPNVNCSLPVVTVLSVYFPSAVAVQVPSTLREPVTGAEAQPALDNDRSRLPVTLIHDDATVQEPTTSPPQGATLEHSPPPVLPPLPWDPPLPLEPPLWLPPPPFGRGFDEEQPHTTRESDNATRRTNRENLVNLA